MNAHLIDPQAMLRLRALCTLDHARVARLCGLTEAQVRELEAATLPRVLTQVDLALINTNYALEAGLNPSKDALVIEGSDSPYVNILVVDSKNKDAADLQKLAKALNSAEVKAFINDKYKGAVVPAF